MSRPSALALALLLFVPSLAVAQTPIRVPVQGVLTDVNGVPFETSVSLTFSIYADATTATPLWRETQTVEVGRVFPGVFDVYLGTVTALPAELFRDNPSPQLGIRVGNDADLVRMPVGNTPSAAYSVLAGSAMQGGGTSQEQDARYVNVAGDTMTGALNVPANGFAIGGTQLAAASGRIGVGTSAPERLFHVAGDAKVDGNLDVNGTFSAPFVGDVVLGPHGGFGSYQNLLVDSRNLLTSWFNEANGAAPFTNYTVDRNAGFTAPDGTPTAIRFRRARAQVNDNMDYSQTVNLVSGVTYTLSVWARSFDGTPLSLRMGICCNSLNVETEMRLDGTWRRYSVTGRASTTAPNAFRILMHRTSPPASLDVLVWGAQGEASSTPTTYVATDATSVPNRAQGFVANGSGSHLFSGNVGIGTPTPQTRLHVADSRNLDNVGYALVENTRTTGGAVSDYNAQILARNRFAAVQSLAWEDRGARIGVRSSANGGLGNLYFTSGGDRIGATLLAGGNFGVNEQNPAARFHVSDDRNLDNVGYALFENVRTTGGAVSDYNAQLLGKSFYGTVQTMVWENRGARIGMRSATNGGAGDVFFTTGNDAIAMTLRGANVGIATTTPGERLHVMGRIAVGQTLAGDNADYGISIYRHGTGDAPGTYTGSSMLDLIDISTDGPATPITNGLLNIGVGRINSNDPNALNASLFTISTDDGDGAVRVDGRRNLWLGWPRGASPLPTSTQRDSLLVYSGEVGIGKTEPAAALEVIGADNNGNRSSGLFVRVGHPTGGIHIYSGVGTDNQASITMQSHFSPDRGVRLRTLAASGGLYVEGYNGGDGIVRAASFSSYSSRKFKDHVLPLQNALGLVERLRGVTYDSKLTKRHEVGVIAEEVQEVLPEVIAPAGPGIPSISVDYGRLTAVLIEAVKAQQKQIEAQQRRIEALERKQTR